MTVFADEHNTIPVFRLKIDIVKSVDGRGKLGMGGRVLFLLVDSGLVVMMGILLDVTREDSKEFALSVFLLVITLLLTASALIGVINGFTAANRNAQKKVIEAEPNG